MRYAISLLKSIKIPLQNCILFSNNYPFNTFRYSFYIMFHINSCFESINGIPLVPNFSISINDVSNKFL